LAADLEQRFAALMKAEGAALTRLAASYARGSDDRDDLFQDIAVAIWQALPRFRGECSERTFLFRIAHNRGIAHIARRRPHMIESGEDLELRDERPDPEQSLSAEQQRQRLLNAVLMLPVGYRQVVSLALEGMSYQEIGDILGISESNAGARLTRARHMLRRSLNGTSYGT
jgi:RNA polymerase sigma-70 factor (ECF subfamily)